MTVNGYNPVRPLVSRRTAGLAIAFVFIAGASPLNNGVQGNPLEELASEAFEPSNNCTNSTFHELQAFVEETLRDNPVPEDQWDRIWHIVNEGVDSKPRLCAKARASIETRGCGEDEGRQYCDYDMKGTAGGSGWYPGFCYSDLFSPAITSNECEWDEFDGSDSVTKNHDYRCWFENAGSPDGCDIEIRSIAEDSAGGTISAYDRDEACPSCEIV